MNKILIKSMVFLLTFLTGIAIYACEMHFSLMSPDNVEQEINPGKEIALSLGGTYTLRVEFGEDHRKCVMAPEDTMYILQEEKWKPTKEYLPLGIIQQGDWEQVSSSKWEQQIVFTALKPGTWDLEIIRDCPKGGYDEYLTFQVQ